MLHKYHYRELPEYSACVGGHVLSCAELSRKVKIFDEAEPRGFARLGCSREYLDSCQELLKLLRPVHRAGSAEAQALSTNCKTGGASLCKGLGLRLFSAGDTPAAGKHLSLACEQAAGTCSSSAAAAAQADDVLLSRQLLASGYRRGDALSCRAFLRAHGTEMEVEARERLELRLCVIGDFPDCRAPMARDLARTCERLCSSPKTRWFCVQCALEASKGGEPGLARMLLEPQCAGGYRTAFEKLQRTKEGEPRRRR